MSDPVLVIDVGTTGLRAAVMQPDASLGHVEYRAFAPDSPFPGLVEFDATELGRLVLDAARTALAAAGDPTVAAVGVAAQRATTIMWDRSSGTPVGPAIGWQDLRTIGECMAAKSEHGLELAPNQTATKIQWLLANALGERNPADVCVGTVDTWIAWTLSGGSVHATDHTNAAVTGLYSMADNDWNLDTCATLGIDPIMLPAIVDSSARIGQATALPGAPPIASLIGDQQASLVGQGCIRAGMAKVTFGTGGMLDVCTGTDRPTGERRTENGTFPIVAWTATGGLPAYGVEAIMLSAGSNVEWLRDDLGLIGTAAESHDVAARCATADGVVYVPALLGLGTPHWDYGARGTLVGLTRGTGREHVVRAVLEGVAHRGADLVEAAEADTGLTIPTLRVDGGMSRNPTFVQALANATGRPVGVSPVVESTTLGAGFLAGVAVGIWADLDEATGTFSPTTTVEPVGDADRARWIDAVGRAVEWYPDLSALDF